MRAVLPLMAVFLFLYAGCQSQDEAKDELTKSRVASSPVIDPELSSIDRLVESSLRQTGAPGAALIIVRDGKIQQRGYGYSDFESHLTAEVNTVWPIASITKVLTSMAVMQLVESKKVRLDVDVNTYLKRVKVPNTFTAPITVADLLRHTSGLDELPGRRFERANEVPSLDKFLAEHLIRYRPAGQFTSYSSYGMSLAGLLIEDVTGSSYASYLDVQLFKPLGMTSARIMTKSGDESGVATPYEMEEGKAIRIDYEWYATPPVASAVLSASDMGRILIALTSGNPGVLSRSSLQLMYSTQATLHPLVPGWGYGFQLDDFNDLKIAEHGGDIGGFASLMSIVPEKQLGLFIVHHGEGLPIRFDIRQAILEKYFPGRPPKPVSVKGVNLKPYEGTYRASFRCHTCSTAPSVPEFEVSLNDDGTLGLWGKRWIPTGEDLFAREDGRARIAFVRDAKGNVVALSGGSWRVGERVKP